MYRDVITAMRQLRRAPGTALVAIVTLAVGIGATTAVFSFVAAVMSAASPASDMDRLVGVWSHNRSESETKGLVSPGDFVDWSARATSFDATAARIATSFNVSGAGVPVRAPVQLVTPEYFAIFGWRTFMGRGFTIEDAVVGAPRTVVLSQAYWQNMLGARSDIVGQTLKLDGEPATIIGVLPRIPAVTGLFMPLVLDHRRHERSSRTLFVMARLRSGVSIEAARSEMEGIGVALEREFPTSNRGWAVNTRPLQEEFVGAQARLVFALLAGIVTTVLLIGCVNIANLLLARGAARRGELAIRLALGARGWRVVRQMLIECAVLATFGAALSVVVSRWTLGLLSTLGAVDSPWVASDGVNARVLALTAFTAVASTVIAGLMPALSARRTDIVSGLRESSRSSSGGTRRTTRILVAGQVALAVMLLVVAGLATRTLVALQSLDPGLDMNHVLTATVTLPDVMTPQAAAQWTEQALIRARQLPGVTVAGATSRLPFAGRRWNPNRGLEIEGHVPSNAGEGRWAVDYVVTPGLFEALRVRVVEGRTFTSGDGAGAPLVAIVNQAMARRFWPDRSPIGARLRHGDEAAGDWWTVVGVVADIRNDDADQPPAPYLYMPLAQRPSRTMTLALRTAGDPTGLADPLRRSVAAFDADQALYDVRTMRAVWEQDLEGSRVLIQVMGALAAIALGLAGLGVWSVAAQSVGQRTREIGLRMALGANARQVGAMIAWQGLTPIAIGLVVGISGGLALGRIMRSILFQVSPTDPVTMVSTIVALAAVGALATMGPAIRASRLDPLTALRME